MSSLMNANSHVHPAAFLFIDADEGKNSWPTLLYGVSCSGLNSFCATSQGWVGFNCQFVTAESHLGSLNEEVSRSCWGLSQLLLDMGRPICYLLGWALNYIKVK